MVFALALMVDSLWSSAGSVAQQQVDPFAAISAKKDADLSTYLASGDNPNAADAWGGPLGTAEFVHTLERSTQRPLAPQKRGRRPRAIAEPRESVSSLDGEQTHSGKGQDGLRWH